MSDANIFKVMGLIYLSIGLGMLVNPRFYKRMLNRMMEDEAVLFVVGILVLVVGTFLVIYHNTWEPDWIVVITFFGWLALLKGLMIIVVPETSMHLYHLIKISRWQLGFYGLFILLIGVVMAILGYAAL